MDILKKPLITEKVSSMNEGGKYGFVVDKRANKVVIKKQVESIYGVTVEKVCTMRYAGKKRRRHSGSGGTIEGKRPSFKKAIVTLKEGDMIDFYSEI